MEHEELYTKLKHLDNIFGSYGELYSSVVSSGAVNIVCYSAIVIAFLTTMIRYSKSRINGEQGKSDILTLITAAVVITLFGIPAVYQSLAGIILNIARSINTAFDLDIFETAQQIQHMWKTIYMESEYHKINLWNPATWDTGIVNMLFAICFYAMMVSIYSVKSMPAIILMLVIISGPICASIGILFRGVFINWLKTLFAGIFMIIFVSAIIAVVKDTGMIVLLETSLKHGVVITALIVTLGIGFIIAYSMPICGYIFGSKTIGYMRIIMPLTIIEIAMTSLMTMLYKGAKAGKMTK